MTAALMTTFAVLIAAILWLPAGDDPDDGRTG